MAPIVNGITPNIFAQQPQAIQPTQAVGRKSGEASGGNGKNPFGSGLNKGETSGLNSMQTGDIVSFSAQAGKSAGQGRILGYA